MTHQDWTNLKLQHLTKYLWCCNAVSEF